ncbi:unnamed protein product, partial [Rotaria sp. Silwood2]
YYRDAAGVLIVYDVTNAESFSRIRRWIEEINKYCDGNIPKVLIGNKDDIVPIDSISTNKAVLTTDAEQYAHEMNLPFFETSAKDNKNVTEAFYAITRLALHQRLQTRNKTHLSHQNDLANGTSSSQGIRLKGSKNKDKKYSGTCCK